MAHKYSKFKNKNIPYAKVGRRVFNSLFDAETLKLREYYLMEQADDGWLARKKLKDIGCDIEEWYREEGGKTDA